MKRMVVFGSTRTGWYERAPDGTVTRIVIRRTDDPSQMYHQHRFEGDTIEAADAAYETWLGERAETVLRGAARRARWGPQELQDGDAGDRVDGLLAVCAKVRREQPGLVAWIEAGAPPIRSDDDHRATFGSAYEQKPRRVS